jgi:hypothetical protein
LRRELASDATLEKEVPLRESEGEDSEEVVTLSVVLLGAAWPAPSRPRARAKLVTERLLSLLASEFFRPCASPWFSASVGWRWSDVGGRKALYSWLLEETDGERASDRSGRSSGGPCVLCDGLWKKSSAEPRELLSRSEVALDEGRSGLGTGLSASRLGASCSAELRKSKLVLSALPSWRGKTSETLESEKAEEKCGIVGGMGGTSSRYL